MDRRRGDRLTVSTESWFTEDSMRSSGNEEIHGVMDGAGDHDDHTIHDAHSASEQHHHSPFLSEGVRYRASHVGRHRLTTTTPVVSPRASPPAIVSRVSGRPFSTTVHMSDIFARQVYLVKLCRAIIMYGALTHRLEEYMSTSSLPLEIEGQFSYIPDCMTIGFAHGVELVCASEGINLGKLQDAHDINVDVAHDRLGVKEAARRLDEVSDATPKHKLVFAAKSGLHANVFEFLAAVMMSFMARGFGSINHGQLFCFSALAQSSIVMCLPGYVALCGSLETQRHKIVAASSRMARMAYYTLSLGCGIPIGAALYGMMDSNAASETHCSNPLSREWCFLFVPGFTICLCAILQANWTT
ncbi:hypothetical protein E4U13_000360 [Claviceps humidiphila]|uniref:Threonine/serine exporter-like N-terminal domain-containing protein n=1 Tax=Claviceps humidiphila TaxID=1294629 RepID=A0A9P7TVT3_9HYPO|nr:hypothetical protein E4U13_000360 [Claviceps humidiphila]